MSPLSQFSSWLAVKDVAHLSASDIESYLSAGHRKGSGGLKEAYETAKDPADWLKNQQEVLKDREEAEREAEEGVDELEDEEAGSGGKRKRAAAKPAAKKKAKSAAKVRFPTWADWLIPGRVGGRCACAGEGQGEER